MDENLLRDNMKLVHQVIHDLEFIPQAVTYDDVFQIGMIALWGALKDYEEQDDKDTWSTYGYKRIRNEIIDNLRQYKAKKRQDIFVLDEIMEVEEEVMNNMFIYEMEKLVGKENSDMFIKKHLKKATLQQLADEYGLSVKQVRSRLEKTKQILKENIES